MKFKTYLEHLNALAKEKPESLDYEVITSGDDEGNFFTPVLYAPAVGEFDDGEFEGDSATPNVVCLN